MAKPIFAKAVWAHFLRRIMAMKGVGTQAELAQMSGIPESMISRYVNGRQAIGYDNALKIASALGFSEPEFWYLLCDTAGSYYRDQLPYELAKAIEIAEEPTRYRPEGPGLVERTEVLASFDSENYPPNLGLKLDRLFAGLHDLSTALAELVGASEEVQHEIAAARRRESSRS